LAAEHVEPPAIAHAFCRSSSRRASAGENSTNRRDEFSGLVAEGTKVSRSHSGRRVSLGDGIVVERQQPRVPSQKRRLQGSDLVGKCLEVVGLRREASASDENGFERLLGGLLEVETARPREVVEVSDTLRDLQVTRPLPTRPADRLQAA
jgi:hypothetical protein